MLGLKEIAESTKKEVMDFIAGRDPETIIIKGKTIDGVEFEHDLNYFEGETVEEKVIDLISTDMTSLPQESCILIKEDGQFVSGLKLILTPTLLEEIEELLEQTKDIQWKLEDIKLAIQMGKELDPTQKAFLSLYVTGIE